MVLSGIVDHDCSSIIVASCMVMFNERKKWTVFFFRRLDATNLAKITTNGKAVDKGKGMGIEVPCKITFTDTKPILNKQKSFINCEIQ